MIKSFRGLIVGGVLALGLASGVAHAQVGPLPQPPENYGLPVNPQLAGFEVSLRSSIAFSFSVQVALADVQKVLPAGYTAVPATPGGPNANMTCQFWLQNKIQINANSAGVAPGSYGPFNTFDCSVFASPPPGQQNPLGFEQVQLIRYINNSEINDLRNAVDGAGSSRFANIDGRVRTTTGGELRIRASIDDPDSGFKVHATLTAVPVINQQLRQAGPLVLRFVDVSVVPTLARNGSNVVVAGDLANITDPAALDLSVKQFRLPGGKLKVLSSAPAVVGFGPEVFYKIRP